MKLSSNRTYPTTRERAAVYGGLFAEHRPLGRAARWLLHLVPRRLPLPVLSGINRGRLWMIGAGINACWVGNYEREKLDLVAGTVRPGMTVFDVGAHGGYYSLAFARLVGPQGKVVAFEPNPVNLQNLRRHLKINGIANVEVVPAAVAGENGTLRFETGDPRGSGRDQYMGRLSAEGIEVRAVALDEFGSPDVIKMDIEGGEGAAMAGARRILAERKATVFVALHGISDERCIDELRQHGYRVDYIGLQELRAQPPER